VKSADQQGVLALHRIRDLLVRQRTMLINAIRGHCVEFRMIARKEACAGGHHWGREISRLGHAVKLIPPAYVKPFV